MIFEEKEYLHRVPIQLRFNDIDSMNIVNNAVYQQYFDVARIHYFRDVIQLDILKSKTSIVVAQIQINYIKPVTLVSDICIFSKVLKLGDKSLLMKQFLYDNEYNEVMTINETIMVGFDLNTLHSTELPFDWKQKIEVYEGGVTFKAGVK